MSKSLGNLYEDRVSKYLTKKGFDIVARNYHSRFGEIDIIASKGNKLVVIEVKGGKDIKKLSQRVDCKKLKRIVLTFQDWLDKNCLYADFEQIFIAALVEGEKITFRRIYLEDCF